MRSGSLLVGVALIVFAAIAQATVLCLEQRRIFYLHQLGFIRT